MDYEQTIDTQADVGRAWTALAAVQTYPQWTKSMSAVEPLDGPELRVGHRFRVRQPGRPVVVWRVCEVTDGRSFQWEARTPGVYTVAYHHLTPLPTGGTRITIGIRQRGPLAGLVALFTAAKTRRYLVLEAAGLKAAAEAVPASEVSQ
ncbi:MAG: SRPBCC family protein [Micromonosporaceae bacterium]|nr:SRPBCC family protein [Micromonosporaceae bacterium]